MKDPSDKDPFVSLSIHLKISPQTNKKKKRVISIIEKLNLIFVPTYII